MTVLYNKITYNAMLNNLPFHHIW